MKNDMMRKIHYFIGLFVATFVVLHLFNHTLSIFGADMHIEVMSLMRLFYRNIFLESLLLLAVAMQIFSGLRLFIQKRKITKTFFDKLQLLSGGYLAAFFLIHVGAVLTGRLILRLDTNFYFGAAGLNEFPINLFFVPYYALAIIAFFGHIAAVHQSKMHSNVMGLTPLGQSYLILFFGIFLTILILLGLTNFLQGIDLPLEYKVLAGK